MNRRTLILIGVAVGIAVLLGGAWLYSLKTRKPPIQFDTAKVERGRIVAKVTATGTLSALVTVQVGTQVSGRIAALYADFNSPVKKGQVIAKIDPLLYEAAVDQAKANLVAAEGNLVKSQVQAVDARRQYVRQKQLREQKLNAQQDLDTAQANADAADAQVKASEGALEQAQAALKQAKVNLDYTNIASPTKGTVISRNVDVGQTVAASLQAPTLFLIAEDLSKMQVDTSVAESDIGRLQPRMPATFTVDAYPAEVFHGTVRQIRQAPQTVQNVVTYDAVIDVDNTQLKLMPGMTANATFVYAEKDDVAKVPNAALRFRPPPGMLAASGAQRNHSPGSSPRPGAEAADRRTVWILSNEQASSHKIRIGISDGTFTEITEGDLKPGELAITDAVGGGPATGMAAQLRRGGL